MGSLATTKKWLAHEQQILQAMHGGGNNAFVQAQQIDGH
jgi:hypothetical protein